MSKKPQKNRVKSDSKTEALFPMRINKYLALKNYATRRGANKLIEAQKVYINDTIAVLGEYVREHDKVTVTGQETLHDNFLYFAFNKPIGMLTGKEEHGGTDIVTSLPPKLKKLGLFPVGRLDKESHGLIILTNDGRVTDRLLNPKFEHEKEYEVITARPLRENFEEKIKSGIFIEGYMTKPAHAEKIGEKKFRITLTEGKTHQIRRMVSALFNEVKDLKRVRIMNIHLDALKPGGAREIKGEELTLFLQSLDLL